MGTFSLVASFPLFFLLFNEIFKIFNKIKCCKICKRKKKKKVQYMDKNLELETKSLILDDEDDLNINNPNSLGINRESIIEDNKKKDLSLEESDIFSQNSKNNIVINLQTPILNEKPNNLFESYSEE